ncbi:MAG: GLPGLI family protein [Bacteroidales bacterium]|nr:GLPGLI family protein [Bacteroidales bacterium]
MKLTIISISFSLFITGVIFAQPENGNINYIIKHKWSKKMAAIDYISKSKREHYDYVWGNEPEYEEKAVLMYNSNSYRFEDEEDQSKYVGHSWRSSEYFIYRELENHKTYDVIRMFNKLYVIEDSIKYPKWRVLNDLKEIAGHICMNAQYTDTIKNNSIVAWFALDWPQNFGPEHYGGLPGVILEININNGAKVIRADTIIAAEPNRIIAKPEHKKRVKNITQTEYNQLIIDYIDECKKEERPYFWGLRY